jgi:chromosome segregation ATPase
MAKAAAAAAQKAQDEANASLQDAAAKMAEASTNVTEYTKQAHDPSATPAERAEAEQKAQYWQRKLEEAQRQAVEARAAIEAANEAKANAEAQLKAIQNQTGENPAAGGPEVTKVGQELAKLQQQAAQAMTHADNLQKKYEELEAAGDPDAAMWKMQAEAARAVAQQMAKRAEDMRRALEVMEKTK